MKHDHSKKFQLAKIGCFIFVILTCSFAAHPFFVSVTEIQYKKEEKLLQISSKLFFDDFENAVKKDLNLVAFNIMYPKDSALADTYIKTYFLKHFTVLDNNKPITFTYLGYEVIKEGAWVYLEAEGQEEPKKMTIVNTLMCDNDKQNNIVQLKGFSKEQNKNLGCETTVWIVN
jgi:hypothetical protein